MVARKSTFNYSEISIGAWNLHGIWQRINSFRYNKLQNPNFLEFIGKKKIFSLIETQHKAEETGDLHINGFKCFSLCRPKDKNKKKYKPSGGIAAYVHNSIISGVEKVATSGSEALILKLKKQFFGLINDIYIVFAYCSPANSSIFTSEFMPSDIFEDLKSKIAQYNDLGSTILMGDLNARTQLACDYIVDENNDYVPVPPPAMYDTDTVATETRCNTDRGRNSYGPKFIELCKTVPLRILNGRKLGDLLGNYTCYTSQGSSSVDYGAVSPELFDSIPYFSVAPPCLPLSDQTPIELGLRITVRHVPVDSHHDILPGPDKVVWDRNLTQKYKTMLESPDCTEVLRGFTNTGVLPNQVSVDSAVSFISNIMLETVKTAGMQVKKGAVPRRSARADQPQKRQKHPEWHDSDCQAMFRNLKKTSSLLKNDQKNTFLKGKVFAESKQYNKMLKFKQKQFTEILFSQLETMHQADPRKYMQLVNSLKSGRFDKTKPSDTEAISPDEWFSHFSNLLGKPVQSKEADLYFEEYFRENVDKFSSELDLPFKRRQ